MPKDLVGSGRLRIGVNPQDNENFIARVVGQDAANPQHLVLEYYANSANAPTMDYRKARGTVAAAADAAQNDRVIDIRGLARSTTFQFGGAFRSYVDAAVVAGQNPASRLEFETNANNAASQAQAAIFSNGFLVLGNAKVVRGVTESLGLLNLGGNSTVEAYLERASTDTTPPRLLLRKYRGTLAAPGDTADQDIVGTIQGQGRSTTMFDLAAIRVKVEGTVTAAQRPPSVLEFQTNPSNTTPTVKMIIDTGAVGFVGISNNLFSNIERPSAHLHILGEGGDVHMHIEKCVSDAEPPLFEGFKARGSVAVRSAVILNDATLRLAAFARSSTGYHDNAQIQFAVDDAVVAAQAPSSRIEFYTNPVNTAPILYMKINSAGLIRQGITFCTLANTETLVTPTDGHVLSSDSGENAGHLYGIRASTANGHNHTFRRCRGDFVGNIATPTNGNVATNDRIMRLEGAAWSGATGWWGTARIDTFVEGAVTDNQRPGSKIDFLTNQPNGSVTMRMTISNVGNVGVNTTSFGASSEGVIGVGNRAVAPTGNPTAGGILYAESGAGKWRGSGGTTTTFGPAEPHCPVCGSDFGVEFERTPDVEPDPAKRYLALCFQCLYDHIHAEDGGKPKPWVRKAKPAQAANPAPDVFKDPDGIADISQHEEALERAARAPK